MNRRFLFTLILLYTMMLSASVDSIRVNRDRLRMASQWFLSTEHELDRETGYTDRHARWYDEDALRFIQVDPLAEKFETQGMLGSSMQYGFASKSPGSVAMNSNVSKAGIFSRLLARFGFAAKEVLKPLGLGSTGRTTAANLVEQMAMKDAMANPQLGKVLENMKPLSDPRWQGWLKMQYSVKTQNGVNAVIHYVGKWENGVLKAVDDFKFK